MQNLVTRVAITLAVLTLPLALLSSWVEAFVTDSDRYVETVAPLAADPVVKQAAVRYLERETMALVDFDQLPDRIRGLDLSGFGVDSGQIADLIGGFLGGSQVMDALRPAIEVAVHEAVTQVVYSPAFATAWEEANRTAHEQMIAVLEDDRRNLADGSDRITIQLATVLNTIIDNLEAQRLLPPGAAPRLDPSFSIVRTQDLEEIRTVYDLLNLAGFWLPVAFVVFLATAVVAGRPRRRVLVNLGVGFLVGALLLKLLMAFAKDTLAPDTVDPGSGDRRGIFDVVWEALTRDLVHATSAVLIISGLAVIWLRTVDDPALPRQQLVYGKVGLSLVFLVLAALGIAVAS